MRSAADSVPGRPWLIRMPAVPVQETEYCRVDDRSHLETTEPIVSRSEATGSRPDHVPHTQVARGPTVDDQLCIGCGTCLRVCPRGAISMDGGVASIDPSLCAGCAVCMPVCPVNAIVVNR